MLNSTIKTVGAIFFVGVALTLLYAVVFGKDQPVPDILRGCYQSSQGQVAIVERGSIIMVGSGHKEITVNFENTNLWDQLAPKQGVVPRIGPNGTLMLIHSSPGNVVKISSAALTFFLGNGEQVVFSRARCKNQA